MSQEREKFENRFDTIEKEVLVLTEGGISASRGGADKLWQAAVTVLAVLDVATGELTEKKCRLNWQMTEAENNNGKVFDIQGETIYRLRVQESLPFLSFGNEEIPRGNTLWVRAVMESDCSETHLEKILAEFRKPVILQLDAGEELLLDKSVGMFSGEGHWNGEECLINMDVDEECSETAKNALETWKRLVANCREWDDKARKFAAEELTDNANDWAQDEDENAEEITKEDFANRLSISEICVSIDGNFEIFYDDDDMFWGHVVIASGNIETGIEDAYMAG